MRIYLLSVSIVDECYGHIEQMRKPIYVKIAVPDLPGI